MHDTRWTNSIPARLAVQVELDKAHSARLHKVEHERHGQVHALALRNTPDADAGTGRGDRKPPKPRRPDTPPGKVRARNWRPRGADGNHRAVRVPQVIEVQPVRLPWWVFPAAVLATVLLVRACK